jgi:hypothetical protein
LCEDVCQNGDWLQLETCTTLWNAKRALDAIELPQEHMKFDECQSRTETVEKTIFGHLEELIRELGKHTEKISDLFVNAAIKEEKAPTEVTVSAPESETVPATEQQQQQADGFWCRTISFVRGVVANFSGVKGFQFERADNVESKPVKAVVKAVLRVTRFNGLLVGYSGHMNACIGRLQQVFIEDARKILETHRAKGLIGRRHVNTDDQVLAKLFWKPGADTIADEILSVWVDMVKLQIPLFTDSWNVPDACLEEVKSEERVKLLKEMTDVIHALTALKELKRKCNEARSTDEARPTEVD